MEPVETETTKLQYSRSIPISTFIILDIATFGIYSLYWMYKQWKLLKKEFNLKVSPFWRSFFAFIWSGVLAEEIHILAKNKNIETTYKPWLIGVTFFVLTLSSRLPDPYWLICYFTFLPLIPLVRAMNSYYAIEDASLPRKELEWWHILLIILGLIILLFATWATFFPSE